MDDRWSYGHDALETWRRRGATWVEFWCLRPGKTCRSNHFFRIEDAIKRWGPGTLLVMLARRARCRHCGWPGCHVQVSAPDSSGCHYRWHDSRRLCDWEVERKGASNDNRPPDQPPPGMALRA